MEALVVPTLLATRNEGVCRRCATRCLLCGAGVTFVEKKSNSQFCACPYSERSPAAVFPTCSFIIIDLDLRFNHQNKLVPAMPSKAEILEALQTVAFERICCSCWALVLTKYLDTLLGSACSTDLDLSCAAYLIYKAIAILKRPLLLRVAFANKGDLLASFLQ